MAPGASVAGWRIERELARGGMGVIYLARHPRLPRLDVLKVLPTWLADDGRFRERFLREATRVSGLSHPHIVVVHDSGEYEGMLYLAMQYVRGGDLRAQLADGPLPTERALLLAGQIGSALDAAHRAGIVHRDVKPENVLLADTGPDEPDHAVLTDFGISRDEAQLSSLTSTGELLLTPAYAAPEQVAASPLDGRADQYALGCLLYELLTGEPPYRGGSAVAMLAAHLHQPVRALPPGFPSGLDEALQRAMAKAPEDRFPSCRAFVEQAQRGLARAHGRTESSPDFPPAPVPRPPAQPSQRDWTPTRPDPTPTPEPVQSSSVQSGSVPSASLPSASVPPRPFPPTQQQLGPGADPGPLGGRPHRRRAPVLGAVLAAVVAGSAVAAVLALRGDGGTGTPTAAQESPSSPDPGAATGDYASLVARIPSAIRPDCHEATNALSPSAAAYVTASAVCRTSRDGSALEVTYDAVRGNAEVATTYRREVLGIGGRNHAPGNCRTRERDPQTRDRSALRGLYMPIGTTDLDVEAWCDWAGPMYLLQPDDTSSIYVSLRRDGDDGNVSMQEQRYADLLAVRPL